MNISAIVAQNVANKLRNEQIQDESRANFIRHTASLYYNNTINNYKKVCEEVYGKLSYIADSKVGDLFRELNNIMENTGMKMHKMLEDIRYYLGYNAAMQRVVNGKNVPINPTTIEETWKAVIANKGVIAVENTLYFN